MKIERDNLMLYPFALGHLVIAKPSFVVHWLRLGMVPDANFVAQHPDAFRLADVP
jgi:hypothetical protein